MTDRRMEPDPVRVDRSEASRIDVAVADLLRDPQGPRDRQLIHGDAVTVLGIASAHAYVRADKDGYHGFVASRTLGQPATATHHVAAPASHVYSEPDIKSPERMWLTFGSRLCATGESGRFVETSAGFVPGQHLAPVEQLESDPSEVARHFLGTPYLWGGNSRAGIDCSGLVQAALLACGIPCPGDSDLQMPALGHDLPGGTPPERNDLMFWKGHVAIVCDADTLIHATAHYMSVMFEPIVDTIARIDAKGEGPLLAHKRL